MNNQCVCCGNEIPEGFQVCYSCQKNSLIKMAQVVKDQTNLSDEIAILLAEDDQEVKQIINDPPDSLGFMNILQSAAGKLLKNYSENTKP